MNVSELRVVLARLLGDEPETDADQRPIGPDWLGGTSGDHRAYLDDDECLAVSGVFPHGGGLLVAP